MKKNLRRFLKTFLRGFFTLIPGIFTIWVIVFLVKSADHLFRDLLVTLFPIHYYRPGMGLIAAMLVIGIVGAAMQATALPRLVTFLEKVLYSIPVIKTVYSAFKDFSNYLTGQNKNKISRIVMVRIPNSNNRMLGLVTDEQPERDLGPGVAGQILIYFPMSYQIGGYALLVDRAEVEPLTLPVNEAMRYILTAGISRSNR